MYQALAACLVALATAAAHADVVLYQYSGEFAALNDPTDFLGSPDTWSLSLTADTDAPDQQDTTPFTGLYGPFIATFSTGAFTQSFNADLTISDGSFSIVTDRFRMNSEINPPPGFDSFGIVLDLGDLTGAIFDSDSLPSEGSLVITSFDDEDSILAFETTDGRAVLAPLRTTSIRAVPSPPAALALAGLAATRRRRSDLRA